MWRRIYNWYSLSIIVLIVGFGGLALGKMYHDWGVPESDIVIDGDYSHTLGINTGHSVIRVDAELAIDDKKQQLGMMFRNRMDEQDGMLFVFPDAQMRYFWMKNTLLPLDILFIGPDARVVSIHENAVPHDETLISSKKPASAALELKGGMAKMWGIKEGAIINTPILIR